MENITVTVLVHATKAKVWELWTAPRHIAQWNKVNEDWHSPKVENDLKEGGAFCFRMEAKDGSAGFDHCGRYDKVKKEALIACTLTDGRSVINSFSQESDKVMILETFEPEGVTPVDEQRDFCQSVLNNFKNYVESYRDEGCLLLQFDLHHRLYNNVLDGFTDNEANQRLRGMTEVNHVKYLAGHLLNSNYGLAKMVGLNPEIKWNELFAVMGQSEARDDVHYPSLDEIREEWNRLCRPLREALAGMDAERLQQLPPPPFDGVAATCGELWAFVNHHAAYHIGQIALLRRGFGKAPMHYD